MATEKRRASMIDAAVFAKASEQGRKLLTRGPLATAARYEAGRVHVELNNGCAFEFPVKHAQGLAGAKATDLRAIKIQASGLGLYWPKLEADLYVPSLVKGVLGSLTKLCSSCCKAYRTRFLRTAWELRWPR
jgi:Protein of unknown function (DUF2442)